MKFNINDLTVYYEKYGTSNKNILILPGWGETRNTFKYLIDVLKEQYTVYIFDYPGFGKSNFPKRDLTIKDYSFIIREFIRKKKIDNPVIIAHSFGGRIVIDLFNDLKHPPIKGLILIDIAGIKPKKKWRKRLKERIYKILKKGGLILPKRIRRYYINALIKMFGSKDYAKVDENVRKTFINIVNYDQRELIRNIDVDTLIIWGEKDLDVPLADGYFINRSINNSGLIVVPGSGHFPYLDRAYYVNKVILEYLKSSFNED